MSREGIWQKGSNPQYAHAVVRRIGYAAGRSLVLQDALASQDPLVAQYELFHINGNALFDFKSRKFAQYLTGELFNGMFLGDSACLIIWLEWRMPLLDHTSLHTHNHTLAYTHYHLYLLL